MSRATPRLSAKRPCKPTSPRAGTEFFVLASAISRNDQTVHPAINLRSAHLHADQPPISAITIRSPLRTSTRRVHSADGSGGNAGGIPLSINRPHFRSRPEPNPASTRDHIIQYPQPELFVFAAAVHAPRHSE